MSKKKKKQSSNMLEVQNAAKTLFANISFMSPDSPIKAIALTSSVPNEGKSTTAVELGRAIATSGKTVLLVECDMRRRSLANMLGVRATAGVYAVLTDNAPLNQAICATKVPNMYFIDAEPNIPNPADILSSKRFHKLAELLISSYDYVIFDTPPVGTFVDAAILSTIVDGVVMLVRPNSTKRADLLDAFDQLQKADANVLGICATFCEGTGSEYYYAYYSRSGKRVKTSGASSASTSFTDAGYAPRAGAGSVSGGAGAGANSATNVASPGQGASIPASVTSKTSAKTASAQAKNRAGYMRPMDAKAAASSHKKGRH